jgi:hypothetical protein
MRILHALLDLDIRDVNATGKFFQLPIDKAEIQEKEIDAVDFTIDGARILNDKIILYGIKRVFEDKECLQKVKIYIQKVKKKELIQDYSFDCAKDYPLPELIASVEDSLYFYYIYAK